MGGLLAVWIFAVVMANIHGDAFNLTVLLVPLLSSWCGSRDLSPATCGEPVMLSPGLLLRWLSQRNCLIGWVCGSCATTSGTGFLSLIKSLARLEDGRVHLAARTWLARSELFLLPTAYSDVG